MATASEIKVIEAYIGLLGRAPDPDGLAYWAAELDKAGGTTEALKTLTNNITLNPEWDAGLGAQVAADGSITQAGANTIVETMYLNLFQRAATAGDKTYWGDQLIAGTVTASEMTVLLIAAAQEKGNADSATLALKEEAAQYYTENVTQAQFNRDGATDSVTGVDSPNKVAASQAATDLISAAKGNDYVLSATVTEATVTFTGADDTVTGTFGTAATYSGGALQDINASDNDSLTLSGDAASLSLGTVKDIENISLSLSKAKVGGATIDMTAVTGADETSITAAANVTIVGVNVAGETVLTLDDPKGDVTTTGVTALTVTTPSALAQDMTFDSAMASLTNIGANAINANDTNLVFANNDVAINLAGSAATNDSVNITVDNEAALTVSTANIEDITITGGNNDATVTLDVVEASSSTVSYTIAGSNDVTLSASAAEISDSKFTNSGTGDVGITLTGGTASNLDNFGVLGNGLTLGANAAWDLHLASGNTVTNTVTNTNTVKIDANDAATDTSSITVVLTNDTAGLNLDNFETVVIDTDDSRLTSTGGVDLNGANATIGGSNDVTIGGFATGDVVSVVADDLVVGAITVMNDITLVGTNDVGITSIATTQNDVDVDAGGAITTGAIAANITTGTIDLKGDSVSATGTIDSGKGSVSIEATANDVNVTSVVAQNDITLKGDDVTASDAITVDTADGGSVVITATNDAILSGANGVTSTDDITLVAGKDVKATAAHPDLLAANDIVITAGNDVSFDAAGASNMTATAGNITISGDEIDVDGTLSASAGTVTLTGNDSDTSNITVVSSKNLTVNDGNFVVATATVTDTLAIQGDADYTSTTTTAPVVALSTTNDVDITTLISELVVGGAAGDYDLGIISNGTATDTDGISVTTFSGNDSMELDDRAVGGATADSLYTVATGDGKDTVTITDVGAGSIINTGAGADVVSVDANNVVSVTVALGDGADTLTLATGATGTFTMGNDSDTLDITAGANLTGATVTGVETLVVDGNVITVDQAFLSNDSTYNISGGNATITATGISAADMSNVTYAGGNTTGVDLTAAATGSTMVGTSNADRLTAGNGVDNLTGGAGADVLEFGNGGGGASVAALIAAADIVTGFGSASDIIDWDATLVLDASGVISAAGKASIAANGTVTFNAADDTLTEQIIAVEASLADASSNNVDGTICNWTNGGNTYVYISDGTDGVSVNDQLIKLVGATAGAITITGGGAAGNATIATS